MGVHGVEMKSSVSNFEEAVHFLLESKETHASTAYFFQKRKLDHNIKQLLE